MYTSDYINENCPSLSDNFFQSKDFFQVLSNIGWRPRKISCGNKGSQASLIIYTQKKIPVYSDLFPYFTVYYGPTISTCDDIDKVDGLLVKLINQIKEFSCTSINIRTPFPYPLGSKYFRKNGFHRVLMDGEYSVIIDLDKAENELLRGMKRNARRCIVKAEKKGVEIKDIDSEIELKKFYNVYFNTAKRRNFIPYSYKFFKELWSKLEPKNKVKFYMAIWKGKAIGGIINTFNKGESVPYIMGSLNEYWKLRPNHLLIWQSMKWSKERGSSLFKLSYLPKKRNSDSTLNYYQFKSSFGGKITEECTFYTNIISRLKYNIHNALNNTPKWRFLYNFARTHG